MALYFIFWVTIQYYFTYFFAQNFPVLSIMGSHLAPNSFDILPSHVCVWCVCFRHFLNLWHCIMVHVHLAYSQPQPRIRYLSWLILLENGMRKRDLGTRCALASRLSQLIEKDYMCVTNPCVYTYLHIFLYVSICIYIKLNMSSQ